MIAIECTRPGANGGPPATFGAILDDAKNQFIRLKFETQTEAEQFIESCEAAGLNLSNYHDSSSSLLVVYLALWRHAYQTALGAGEPSGQ